MSYTAGMWGQKKSYRFLNSPLKTTLTQLVLLAPGNLLHGWIVSLLSPRAQIGKHFFFMSELGKGRGNMVKHFQKAYGEKETFIHERENRWMGRAGGDDAQ